MYCDLHTHSCYSDGTDTPQQLVELAMSRGLKAIALTDHNTVAGLPAFLEAARGKDILAIPGAEFSVDLEGKELHLLGLFIPPSAFPVIEEKMSAIREKKEQSNRDLARRLTQGGYPVDYDQIRCNAKGYVSRAHIAQALTDSGYTPSVKDAFQTLLSPEKGFYIPPERVSLWEMLPFLRQLGAVPALAHPFLDLTLQELEQLLPRAKEAGLIGMEVGYSTFSPEQTNTAAQLCDRFGLLPSGGSDHHGAIKPHIQLGIGTGDLAVPFSWAQALIP